MLNVNDKKDARTECYDCKYSFIFLGSGRIRCNKPDADIALNICGVKKVWFSYPTLFNPELKTVLCNNYEK